MAYDAQLLARIRTLVAERDGFVEKAMFGGVAFLLNGNMCCGVHRDDLIGRLDRADGERALDEEHVRPFDLTGRPMKGWLLVGPAGVESDEDLSWWVDRASEFAGSLAPK